MCTEKPVRAAILGGGVIGLTTGILLNIQGMKTKIYTEHLLGSNRSQDGNVDPPELASIYAAASIIPHSVDHPKGTS